VNVDRRSDNCLGQTRSFLEQRMHVGLKLNRR
jgi:hypothetical protein